MLENRELRLPALELVQGSRRLYTFAVEGKLVPCFAAVSRVRRPLNPDGSGGTLAGYQRPEVLAHIKAIRTYLESEAPLLPNGLVVAFDESVRFEPLAGSPEIEGVQMGTIVISYPVAGDEHSAELELQKPGFIVDGQQRTAALREALLGGGFPVIVNGFVADVPEQRAQFILVNATKPLPKGLVYELLPGTVAQLPPALARKKFPALLLERLNGDEDSPLRGLVRTPTCVEGVLKDNSLLRFLEQRLSDGALFPFREGYEAGEQEQMLSLVKDFWRAVAAVFPHDYGLPTRKSRLLHGAGVSALGFLLDWIADDVRSRLAREPSEADFRAGLELVADACAWSSGSWRLPGLELSWSQIQNTPRDQRQLADALCLEWRRRNAAALAA